MKKLILAATLFCFAGTFTTTQAQGKMKPKKEDKMMMKEGVMMKDNKMMECKDNKCMPMTETYTCSDGCKVMSDGTVMMKDGKKMMLKNGQGVMKDGKMTTGAAMMGGMEKKGDMKM